MTEEKIKQHSNTSHLFAIIGVSVGLGIVFDYLFYRKVPGVSFPLYIALILAALFGLSRYYRFKLDTPVFIFGLLSFFFSSMVFARSSPLLTFLNVVTSLFLLLFLADAVLGKKIREYALVSYIAIPFLPLIFLKRSGESIGTLVSLHKNLKKDKMFFQILKGAVMAAPFLFVFALLFSSADMVFEKYLLRLTFINISSDTVTRLLFIFLVSLVFTGAYTHVLRKKDSIPWIKTAFSIKPITIGIVETSVFLGLISGLFLIFIGIQFTYLFGGIHNIAVEGLTYAEYARKGFFELAAVAAISFFLLSATEKFVFRKDIKHTGRFKIASGILIAEIFVIIASAFLRLMLYENAYGFTALRFYSHTFIIWLAAVFLILGYKIFADKPERFLLFYGFSSLLVLLALVNFINPDVFIARQNIRRFSQTGKLDFLYLERLSDDAIGEIAKLLDSPNEEIRKSSVNHLYTRKKWGSNQAYDHWQSTTLSRIRAKNIFENRARELEERKDFIYSSLPTPELQAPYPAAPLQKVK